MYYHPVQQKINNSEPIIFIHGTGMDHTVWTLPVRYFSRKKTDVLAIDLPGHGKNEDKPLMIIAETIKGKGISFMEGNNDWHVGGPKFTPEVLSSALKELKEY